MKEELKCNDLSFFILSDVFFTKKAIRSTLEGKVWAEKYSLSFNGDLSTTEDFLNFLPQLKTDILFLDTRLLNHEPQQVILFVKENLPQSFVVLLNDSLANPIVPRSTNDVIVLEKPLHHGYLIKTVDSILEQINESFELLKKDDSSLSQKEDVQPIQTADEKIVVEDSKTEVFEKNTVILVKETEENCQNEQTISKETETSLKMTDNLGRKDDNCSRIEEISLKIEEKNVTMTENISGTIDFFELEPQIIEEDTVELEGNLSSLNLTSSHNSNEENELTFDDFYRESSSNQEFGNSEQSLITFDLEPTFSTVSDEETELLIETDCSQESLFNDTFITFELDSQLKTEESTKSDKPITFSLEEEEEAVFVLSNGEQESANYPSINPSDDDLFVQLENDSLPKTNNDMDSDISFDLNPTSNRELNELNNDLTFDLTDHSSFNLSVNEKSNEGLDNSFLMQDNRNENELNFKSKKETSVKLNETNSSHSNPSLKVRKESFGKQVKTNSFSKSLVSEESPNSKNEYKNGAPLYNETTPSFSVQNDLNFNLDIDAMDSDDKDDEIVITPPKAFYPSGVDRQTQRLNKVRNQHQNQWGPKK